jgi:hypothetical protein
MEDEPTIVPAYIDESGAGGRVRNLTTMRDHEFALVCALVFEPNGHAEAIRQFTPGFEDFRNAKPASAKLHITDAFKSGNEEWAKVANRVREDLLQLILRTNPIVVYAARRLRLSRIRHEEQQDLKAAVKEAKRPPIRIVRRDCLSDWRVEDDLIACFAVRLDAFGEMASQVHEVQQIDLLFDQTDEDVAKRYEEPSSARGSSART